MDRVKKLLPKLKKIACSPYLIAFAVPFLLCMAICIEKKVYPFGATSVLDMDMYHQYCPYFIEFRDILKNGRSFFYNWNMGLGTDFVAVYAYYLASPVNWLLVLCPADHVIEFMLLLIWVKISLCGTTFFAYLDGHYHLRGKDGKYHRNSAAPALVFSVTYALSGYVAAFYWNVMWMDCIFLAPLIILGLERLVEGKRASLYYWTLSLAILTNYYISYMICLFLVLYFIILFLEQKTGRLRAALRFALYSLLAGGTGMILIIPEAAVLGNSVSAEISWPEKMEWYYHLLEGLARFCASSVCYKKGDEHWPNIYCGVFMLLLIFIYLLNRRINWQKKLPRVILLAFFVVSFCNNYLDFLWHGLHFPHMLPARQGFLFTFLLLTMGYEAVRKWKAVCEWQIGLAAFGAAVLIVAGLAFENEELTQRYTFLLTEAFVGVYILLMLADKQVPKKYRFWVRACAVVVVVSELTANLAITSFPVVNRWLYVRNMQDFSTLLDYAKKEQDGNFYRIEQWERKTKNDGALYGFPSTTVFSSVSNANVGNFLERMGMESGFNSYGYDGATPLISAMLSVKYIISSRDTEESPLHRIVSKSGNYNLYENLYCLPLGFSIDEDSLGEIEIDPTEVLLNINSMTDALGIEETLLDVARVDVEMDEGVTSFTVAEDGYYFAMRDSAESDMLVERTSGGRERIFTRTTFWYLLNLGYCKAEETVDIYNVEMEEIYMLPLRLNQKVLDQAYAKLSEQTMEITDFQETKISGRVDMKEAGRMIFTIPAEEGWHLYVDGKETESETVFDAFLSVHLDEGEHEIKLIYRTPMLLPGALISVVSLVIYLCIALLGRKRYVRKKDGEK